MERSISSASQPVQSHVRPSFTALNVVAMLLTWQRRISSRRELARLDGRMLADAGITESQRYEEIKKPFWR